MNTSKLDAYLDEKYGVKKEDLNIRIPRVSSNASRYGKESTEDKGDALNLDDFIERWVDRVERSEEEDELGKDRAGQDMHLAESMLSVRQKLGDLGESIPLNEFPFGEIPTSVSEHVARALQKELGSAICKKADLEPFRSAFIYADDELRGILEEMCRGQ